MGRVGYQYQVDSDPGSAGSGHDCSGGGGDLVVVWVLSVVAHCC